MWLVGSLGGGGGGDSLLVFRKRQHCGHYQDTQIKRGRELSTQQARTLNRPVRRKILTCRIFYIIQKYKLKTNQNSHETE